MIKCIRPFEYQVACDYCFAWLPSQKYDDLESEVRKAGWYVIEMTPSGYGDMHVCTKCARKPLNLF